MSDDESQQENQNWAENVQLDGLSDFSKLIEVLRAKFVSEKQFGKLASNEERIRYCLQKNDVRLGFDKFVNNVAIRRVTDEYGKCNEKAKNFRLEGNKCFKQKKYEDALQFYSKVSCTHLLRVATAIRCCRVGHFPAIQTSPLLCRPVLGASCGTVSQRCRQYKQR